MNEAILTIADLAKRYKVSKSSVYNYVRDGRLPQGIYIGKSHRWSIKQLEDFEQALIAGKEI